MSRLSDLHASGRNYFGASIVKPPSDGGEARLRARWDIEARQRAARSLNNTGHHDAAAALYESCAIEWEQLGGYGDVAQDARHMAKRCRRGETL